MNRHLRDSYQGKTLVLRGLYLSDRLRYDSSGIPNNAVGGDWTTDGFVRVTDIHLSHDRLIIKGQRLAAAWLETKQFELRPLERQKPGNQGKETVSVEIEADPGMHNPGPEQVEALIFKIFLTSQDSLVDLVPDYWKPCVSEGLRGRDKNCVFAPELLSIPGVAASSANEGLKAEVVNQQPYGPAGGIFRVGKGVTPPRVTNQQNPEFSEAARVAKFQGVVTLMLVVNKDGTATHIHISKPLGYGLDEKAVHAVEGWQFRPAEKDGLPGPG